MKKSMVISLFQSGISILYKCYNLRTYYGKFCKKRDDSTYCMNCQFCKAQMSGYDATRMLTVFKRNKK